MAVVDYQDSNATTHGLSNRTGENNCFINSVIQVSLYICVTIILSIVILSYYSPGTLASRHFQRSFWTVTRTCVSRAGMCLLYSQGIRSAIAAIL